MPPTTFNIPTAYGLGKTIPKFAKCGTSVFLKPQGTERVRGSGEKTEGANAQVKVQMKELLFKDVFSSEKIPSCVQPHRE